MMFAVFTTIVDVAEEHFVFEEMWPPPPRELATCMHTLSRAMYYADNVGAGQRVRVCIRGRVAPCPPELVGAYPDSAGGGILETSATLHDIATRKFLAAGVTKKIFLVPRSRATLAQAASRFVHQHGRDS
jgi:hypothetical protein